MFPNNYWFHLQGIISWKVQREDVKTNMGEVDDEAERK